MKITHSIVFFVLVLLVVASIFLILDKKSPEEKILLQTLDCQSDKIDATVYNLKGNTSLIGAIITFNKVPLTEEDRQTLLGMGVLLDENSLIIDHMIAQIPTESMCDLVALDNIRKIFIPETSFNLKDYEIKNN